MKINRNMTAVSMLAVVAIATVAIALGIFLFPFKETPSGISVEVLGSEIAKGVAPQLREVNEKVGQLETRVVAAEQKAPSSESSREQLRALALEALGAIAPGDRDNGVRLISQNTPIPVPPGCRLTTGTDPKGWKTTRVWCPNPPDRKK